MKKTKIETEKLKNINIYVFKPNPLCYYLRIQNY